MIILECDKEIDWAEYDQFTAGVQAYLCGLPCFSDDPAFRAGYEKAHTHGDMDIVHAGYAN